MCARNIRKNPTKLTLELMEAVQAGDMAEIRRLLKAGGVDALLQAIEAEKNRSRH